MSEDRWAQKFPHISNATPSQRPTASNNPPNKGVAPTSFHKKKHNHQQSRAEKHLEGLLHEASKKEVLQKRKEFTTVVNVQLDAYESVTSFRIFPLQDLAMEFLDGMMKDYLHQSDDTLTCVKNDAPQQIINQQQQIDSTNNDCKRRRINDNHETITELRNKYVSTYIQEVQYNPTLQKSKTNTNHEFLHPLWSMEPRIFAMETSTSGKRKYIVCNLDLEYCKTSNQEISITESEELLTQFIHELCYQFSITYNITLSRSNIVDLDSSTAIKFSRHLIIHLPNSELFENTQSAGLFAKQLVGRLAEELGDGTLEKKCPVLARNLFVNTKDAVYTRNRLFRLMGSSKFGKPASAALRISDTNEFPFPPGFGNSNFYVPDIVRESTSITEEAIDHDKFCQSLQWEKHAAALAMTLVVPPNASKSQYPILMSCTITDDKQNHVPNSTTPCQQSTTSSSIIANRPASTTMKSSGQSPIPKLDEHILSSLACRGGSQGRIRAWSIDCCDKVCWQSCHDLDCRGFRGVVVNLTDFLSQDVVDEIDDFLDDRELEHLDMRQVVNDTVSSGQVVGEGEFDDEDIDKALRALDLPALVTPLPKSK
eukprot:scaffold53750_cov52-Cyclotella_meneghiniana.AAC.3